MVLLIKRRKYLNWLPLVDIFRTFYFDETIDLKDKLEMIKSNFVFI